MSKITMANIAVMNVQYWHYSFDYFLDSMEKCRLRNIELWTGAPHFYYDHFSSRTEQQHYIGLLRDKIAARGMRVVMVAPEQFNYPVNLAGREPGYRQKSIDYFFTHMQIAKQLGVDRVFVTSGWGLLDEPREHAWQRAVDSLRVLSQHAAGLGITLVIEQLQPYESNLLSTCDDMVRMLDEVSSDALQCCVDVVAMAVVGDRLEAFFERLGKRVQHIHFADGNPSGHYVWGDGNLPMQEYLQVLEKYDYQGFLTLEINDSIYWDDPHRSIERTAQYLRIVLPEI